jgi:hypothetical protein
VKLDPGEKVRAISRLAEPEEDDTNGADGDEET